MNSENRGLVQVYTGDGKGKTTAALGLAMRASGQGKKVAFIQFLKNEPCGEHFFTSQYHPFEIVQLGTEDCFTAPREKLKEEAQKVLDLAEQRMLSGEYDLLILDEISVAIYRGLITTEQVISLLEKKPDNLELVLTGRYAPAEIIKRADLVTEMRAIKHPLRSGVKARRGIEY